MENFESKVRKATGGGLTCQDIETLQINLGLVCNQSCRHCHVSASPARDEVMDWPTMQTVVQAAREAGPKLVDLTGGAPELNPYFRPFVEALKGEHMNVQARTNLTALLVRGLEDMPRFLARHEVGLVASMPCYLEENVRAQRGAGTYENSVEAIMRLNALGYGEDPDLRLDLVYNPGGAFLPPGQKNLEADYRRELGQRFGITFTNLITITNMPIGRFLAELMRDNKDREYIALLADSFNPDTLEGLMCRHQVSVGWDGTLYDCDFNLALGLPVESPAPGHVSGFDARSLARRTVVTGRHCFGCTAGCGSSCRGALV